MPTVLARAETTDFWIAVSTIGPVTFLGIGVLGIDLVRSGRIPATKSRRAAVKVQLVALNVAFFGTLLPTSTAILSLAWGQDLLPPKIIAVIIVVAILAFWIALAAHFYDVEATAEEMPPESSMACASKGGARGYRPDDDNA